MAKVSAAERARFNTVSKVLTTTITRHRSFDSATTDFNKIYNKKGITAAVVRNPRDGFYEVRVNPEAWERATRRIYSRAQFRGPSRLFRRSKSRVGR